MNSLPPRRQTQREAMKRNDYFQIKLTDNQSETWFFKHDETEDRSLVTVNEEDSDLVGQDEIRKVTDALVARGWCRDQLTFIHVGGMAEGGQGINVKRRRRKATCCQRAKIPYIS